MRGFSAVAFIAILLAFIANAQKLPANSTVVEYHCIGTVLPIDLSHENFPHFPPSDYTNCTRHDGNATKFVIDPDVATATSVHERLVNVTTAYNIKDPGLVFYISNYEKPGLFSRAAALLKRFLPFAPAPQKPSEEEAVDPYVEADSLLKSVIADKWAKEVANCKESGADCHFALQFVYRFVNGNTGEIIAIDAGREWGMVVKLSYFKTGGKEDYSVWWGVVIENNIVHGVPSDFAISQQEHHVPLPISTAGSLLSADFGAKLVVPLNDGLLRAMRNITASVPLTSDADEDKQPHNSWIAIIIAVVGGIVLFRSIL